MPRESEGQTEGTQFSGEAWGSSQGGRVPRENRPGCVQRALKRAEGACVVALGSSHALDDHSGRGGEARVVAILHVVGGWAGAAGCTGRSGEPHADQGTSPHLPGAPAPPPTPPHRS